MPRGMIFLLVWVLWVCGGFTFTWVGSSPAWGSVTYYVDGERGDDSWSGVDGAAAAPDGPKLTIEAGIAASQDGDTVVVADGVYRGPGNIDLDFNVGLASGDSRAIVLRSANGAARCVIDCEGQGRGFLFANGEGPDSVVEGFTIRGGLGNRVGQMVRPVGGGIFCRDSGPTIRGCIVTENQADVLNGIGAGGGAYCGGDSELILKDCVIRNNQSGSFGGGGGIFCHGPACRLTVKDCDVSGNNGVLGGGGILVANGSTVYLQNTVIAGNSAGEGGGICVWDGSTMTVLNCTFSVNESMSRGGASRCFDSSIIVLNSIFWGDTSASGGTEISVAASAGGQAAVTVSYSTVSGGYAAADVGNNCVLLWGQGNIESDPFLAGLGYRQGDWWCGGQYRLQSAAGRWEIKAERSSDWNGDGRVNLADWAALRKWWGQRGPYLRADLDRSGQVGLDDLCLYSKSFLGSGHRSGQWLVDAWHSPSIDAGEASAENWTGEMWPHGKQINMGAYGGRASASFSLSAAGNVADLGNDDMVDAVDVLEFSERWMTVEEFLPADMNRNGEVELGDWAILAGNWLWEGP